MALGAFWAAILTWLFGEGWGFVKKAASQKHVIKELQQENDNLKKRLRVYVCLSVLEFVIIVILFIILGNKVK